MKVDVHPIEIVETIKWKKKQKKSNTYPYSGLEVLMGGQGKGKTISATYLIKTRLKQYPKCVFITNVEIKGIKNKTLYFKDSNELVEILKNELVAEQRERIFNIYR